MGLLSMSKLETPLTRKYWRKIGGTLIEEFPIVKYSKTAAPRWIDGVIIRGGERRIAKRTETDLVKGKDVIIVQTKDGRLGMYLMGQAVFSEELMKRFNPKPKSVKAVALCTEDDSVLRPLLKKYKNVKVVVLK